MTTHNTQDFMSSVGRRRGKYAKLTKAGKLTGFLHPLFGFKARQRHTVFIPVEVNYQKGGETVVEIQGRTFNCAGKGCPLEVLRDFSDKVIQDGMQSSETILDGGRNTDSWTLGQLAGKTKGGAAWKYDLRAKQEHVVGWISNDPEEQQGENPCQIMSVGAGLGTSIKQVIEDRQEQKGVTVGDPMQTPYGFRLVYKKDAENPSDKYQAYYADDENAPVTDAVREIMQADADALDLDLAKEVAPSDPNEILRALRSTWISRVVTFEMFLEYGGWAREGGKEPEHEKRQPAKEQTIDNKPSGLPAKYFCSECQYEVKEGVKFCPECGAGIIKVDPAASQKYACVECHYEVKEGVKFCPECGGKIVESVSGTSQGPSEPAPNSKKDKVECPKDKQGCGLMVIPTRFGFCPECGYKGLDVPF